MASISEYELARLARIEENRKVLAALNPRAAVDELKRQDNVAKELKRKVMAEQRARNQVLKAERAKQAPRRASARVAGEPACYMPSFDDDTPDVVRSARQQYLELPSRPRRPKKRKLDLAPLSDEQREALSRSKGWLGDFEHFLTHTLGDSEQNRRQVIKQATKLASGQGVPHPRADATFRAGRAINLGDDFLEMRAEAQEWEDENGEDYGERRAEPKHQP